MASPDVAEFVGLELTDLTAQELIERALASAGEKFPDWTPREGNTEVVLLEEFAAMTEEEVYALNRLGDGVVERVLLLMGLTRDPGAPASASVTFTATDDDGYTIPAGTTVRIDGILTEPLDLTTDTDLVIAPGATAGTVTATATVLGAASNGVPEGTVVEVLDALPGVDTAVTATVTAGGRSAEDSAAYLTRAAPRLSTITTTLVRAADVEAYVASTYPAVTRVKVLDRYNPADPTPGGDDGYVAVAVASAGGGNLGAPFQADLEADLVDRMPAGLKVDVIDADLTTVSVAVTVLALPGADEATVEANVTAAVTAYLNPDAWAWSTVVRRNEVIARADTAAGVDTVLAATITGAGPSGDRVLAGAAPLAVAGVITVTVQAP